MQEHTSACCLVAGHPDGCLDRQTFSQFVFARLIQIREKRRKAEFIKAVRAQRAAKLAEASNASV